MLKESMKLRIKTWKYEGNTSLLQPFFYWCHKAFDFSGRKVWGHIWLSYFKMSGFITVNSILYRKYFYCSVWMLSCIWKFGLPVELNSAFSNYPIASPGITGMSNLRRGWPTKWKMSKAVRRKGVTRKVHKALRVSQWHHQWNQTMIKAVTSIREQQTHRGRKQVRGSLSLKMIAVLLSVSS